MLIQQEAPTISLESYLKFLSGVVASKAGGPDDIPKCVLHDFTFELTHPVYYTISSSIAKGSMCKIRKCTNVTLLLTVKNLENENDDYSRK